MADKATSKRSPTPPERFKSSAEDPDTAAARKELDNTAISDKPHFAAMPENHKASPAAGDASSGDTYKWDAAVTELGQDDAHNDRMREQISSPKKKRAHDDFDESSNSTQEPNGDVSPIGANGRTDRSEPEKKRHRDISSEMKPTESAKDTDKTAESKADIKEKASADRKSETPSLSFKSSGLSGFASQASPFLASAPGTKLTSFASVSGSVSPFGTAAVSKPEASSTPPAFGTGSLANGSSPFGQISGATNTFGGTTIGGAFGTGSTIGSSKLTTFGKPGELFKSNKPAKAFGAPESDAESGDEAGEDGDSNNEQEDKHDKDAGEKEADDEKKKTKLQKVTVDNGEAGEATILQVRAKIYHLDKTATPAVWKERGAGNLKVNVPESCVDLDDVGVPIPGTFDASPMEDDASKIVRLIMRQDATHRIILNTTVIPAMTFQEKTTNKTICVLFTAIEGDGEAVSIQVKMNPANAKSFLNEVTKIQRSDFIASWGVQNTERVSSGHLSYHSHEASESKDDGISLNRNAPGEAVPAAGGDAMVQDASQEAVEVAKDDAPKHRCASSESENLRPRPKLSSDQNASVSPNGKGLATGADKRRMEDVIEPVDDPRPGS